MAAGDKKADSIPPSEKEKDEKKNGGDPTVDAAFKLLNESQAKSKTTEAQVTTALMAKMNASGDLLTSTVKQDFIVKTGNDYADFGLNLGTGAVRNLAEFGKTIAKSVKDPLSVIHDVGSVGAAVVENPNAVKAVVGDGLSKMAFQKGAAEAGNTWGNVLATVGTLWGGARGTIHKVENKAVAGAGSIEQKIAQTNKLLSSVETNVTRLETAAVGPAPRLAEAGLSKPLATRLDGLSTVAKAEAGSLKLGGGTSTLGEAAVAKMEGGTVKIGESAAAKLEGGVVKPLPKEPLGTAPKLDTVRAPKVQEPVLREPVREVSPIKEPIKPTTLKEGPGGLADDAAKVKTAEPVKPGTVADDAAKVKTGEPVKPGTVADDAAKVKTGEPVKPGTVADDAAKVKTGEPVKPGTVADDAAKVKTAEPVKPGAVADDAAKVKTAEPVKPGTVADDAAKVKTAEPVKPGTVADDAAKVKTAEPVKPGTVADDAAKVKTTEPVKPGAVADDAAKVKTTEPGKPIEAKVNEPAKPTNNANVLDDATKPQPHAHQESFVRTEPSRPAKPVGEPVKPATEPVKPVTEPIKPVTEPVRTNNLSNVADDVRLQTQPRVAPAEPTFKPSTVLDDAVKPQPRVNPGEPAVKPGEPTVRPDATDFRPNPVNRPILERPIVSEPLPKIDGGGVTPTDRLKINNLSDHLDRMPTNTPGIGDVKTNLNNFKLEPTPENYRKFADSVRTLERTGGDNLVQLKDKANVALEVARQTTLMHSVNYTTQSIERLVQTSQAQIALIPGGSSVHSQAMDLVSRLQGHARAMVTAQTAYGEIQAFNKLKSETQQLQQMLSQVKGAQSAIENSIKQLEHAQQSLNAANRLVRTGDTLHGQIKDSFGQIFNHHYFNHPAARITSGLIFAIQAQTVVGKLAEDIDRQIKAEEQVQQEKLEKAEHTQATQKIAEEQKQASLYLNSKEIQGQKIDNDDLHERTRRTNLTYGVTIDDYVYYQKAPGTVTAQEEVRQAVQQNFVRPFRSTEQQDKTSVQKFDWRKTRFNADGSASRSDNPYLSSPIVAFRPAQKGAVKTSGSSSDPSHANSLIAKNYAFAVGPQQAQTTARAAVPALPDEAAEKANPDRSSGGQNTSHLSTSSRALASTIAQNDPTTQQQPVASES